MESALRTELTLPNEASTLPLARAYLRELTTLAGFEGQQAALLLAAAEEACANVIDHAYEPGERGSLTVVGELTAAELTIAVQDQGLPFDPDRVPHEDDASRARVSASDGLKKIRESVDRAYWVHKGREGKELRLVKYRPHRDITEHLKGEDLAPIPEDVPQAPPQEYRIERMRPEHAIGVSRCIYRTYGNTYFHDACYYPDRLAQLNETGELVSCVALDEGGEVVGHYALERWGMTQVPERGMAVVSPAHRGRDLMGRMRIFIEEEARRLGLVGVFSVAVTTHVYSQRVNEEFGSDVTGVLLGGGPATVAFKKIVEDPLPQRVTWVVYFTYVLPPPVSIVHAPPHHREMLQELYAGLKEPPTSSPVAPADMVAHQVEFREPGRATEGLGRLEVTYSQGMDNGIIKVHQIAHDTPAELRRATHDLLHVTGADMIELQLPLAQPGVADLCRAAEGMGYFFAGLGPSFLEDGDALLLQYLNVDLDTSQVKLASPFAKELLGYVEKERARVSAHAVR